MPGDPGKRGEKAGEGHPGDSETRGRLGLIPGATGPQTFSVGGPRKGPAYLGFVEQKPHEGGEQQGRGKRGARSQLLGESGKGGGGGLFGQGHGVGGTHAAERAVGYAPNPTRLAKGLRGSPRALLQPGHRSRLRSHRTPSATWGSNRYCGAQRALLRLNLPTARSQPTGPGARAPADWLTRRASSFATSAPGRGGAGPGTTPRPAFAPPREPARGRRRGRRARPKPMTLGPQRRGNPTGKESTSYHWSAQGLGSTIFGVLGRCSP